MQNPYQASKLDYNKFPDIFHWARGHGQQVDTSDLPPQTQVGNRQWGPAAGSPSQMFALNMETTKPTARWQRDGDPIPTFATPVDNIKLLMMCVLGGFIAVALFNSIWSRPRP